MQLTFCESQKAKTLKILIFVVLVNIPFLTLQIFSQAVNFTQCSDCASLPKPIRIPAPQYPSKAAKMHISGKVVIGITIDEDGNVADFRAISGNEMLVPTAIEAALNAKFEPARLVGEPRRPVKSVGQITYNFVLDKEKRRNISRLSNIGIVNGRAIYLPKPKYSRRANIACASGKVKVEVLIGESGTVLHAKAISGNKLLVTSAVRAAEQARFGPMVDGPPIKYRGILIYNFRPLAKCQSYRNTR